jgi:hypothetical protein
MSTLAKDYLERGDARVHPGDPSEFATLKRWTDEFVRSRLATPTSRVEAEATAERYVFEDDPTRVVGDLVRSGAVSSRVVMSQHRLPASDVWIEFTEGEGMRIGLAAGRVALAAGPRVVVAVVGGVPDGRVAQVALVSYSEEKWELGGDVPTANVHWYLDHAAGSLSEDEKDDVKVFFYDLVDACFLLNTPRVAELRPAAFGPRRPSVRARTGRPFVEYKRVVLNIGVAAPHYERRTAAADELIALDEREARRRKLHRVIPHFRTLAKGRERPHVSFVPQHWRGDARLGIVLRENVVALPTKGEKP